MPIAKPERARSLEELLTENLSTDSSNRIEICPGPDFECGQPLPRPPRKPRRPKADRGLPPDEELYKLATIYLERQAKHWPKLVQAGLIPSASDEVLHVMVQDFKHRHRGGNVDPAVVEPFVKYCQRFAGDYNRYSCDKSTPMSIPDQMVNGLVKAHAEGYFVPWAYVFCDYSVTGLDPSRRGYSSYKAVLSDPGHKVSTTYIDDFTRASRDEIEWWKLAALSRRLKKRLIGASDHFDLDDPNSDLLITMYCLVSRMHRKGSREKIGRGMRGAARRGTCLGKLALGFTRRVHRDGKGNVVYRPDGLPRHEPCIDPETKDYRLLMYELFVNEAWSAYKIARRFNKLNVDGSAGWTASAIKKLLKSPTAIGVFIWNKVHYEYDAEEERRVAVRNPRSEWEVFFDPSLAIVPLVLWRAARRKLAAQRRASPLTGRKPSRNQKCATTLFSGTLFCECGAEITLIRSAGKYKQFGCPNGTRSAHGCILVDSQGREFRAGWCFAVGATELCCSASRSLWCATRSRAIFLRSLRQRGMY